MAFLSVYVSSYFPVVVLFVFCINSYCCRRIVGEMRKQKKKRSSNMLVICITDSLSSFFFVFLFFFNGATAWVRPLHYSPPHVPVICYHPPSSYIQQRQRVRPAIVVPSHPCSSYASSSMKVHMHQFFSVF